MQFLERQKGHPNARLKPTPASEEELFEYLNTHASDEAGVIYIHVPFCDHICSFCAMNRSKLGSELDGYLAQLLAEIKRFSATKYFQSKPIKSIYFGGGTPTVFRREHWRELLMALRESFNLQEPEFCSESTLHNLANDKLELMQELGVNRLSIGIQSFDDGAREFYNRTGNGEYAQANIERIRKRFSGTLCCDIIYNYPGQSDASALKDARLCDELGIDSVSFYSLMYFPGSELAKSLDGSYYRLERDKALHDMFLHEMQRRGFRVLEHTKLVKTDEYRYIRMSHAGADILPLGTGAGGSVANYGIYSPRAGVKMIAKKSPREADFARFYNLFQYCEVDLKRAFSLLASEEAEQAVCAVLKSCADAGYIELGDFAMRYKDAGIFYGNNIASAVIDASKPILLKELV